MTAAASARAPILAIIALAVLREWRGADGYWVLALRYQRFETGFDLARAGVAGFSVSDQIPKLMISTACCRLD
jgi:hypothetical protein